MTVVMAVMAVTIHMACKRGKIGDRSHNQNAVHIISIPHPILDYDNDDTPYVSSI